MHVLLCLIILDGANKRPRLDAPLLPTPGGFPPYVFFVIVFSIHHYFRNPALFNGGQPPQFPYNNVPSNPGAGPTIAAAPQVVQRPLFPIGMGPPMGMMPPPGLMRMYILTNCVFMLF